MVCYSTFNSRTVFGLHVVSIGHRRHFHRCARPWYSVVIILERFTSLCEPWIGTRRSVCFAGVNTNRTEAGYLVAASINVPPIISAESNRNLRRPFLDFEYLVWEDRRKIERIIRERKPERRRKDGREVVIARSSLLLYVRTQSNTSSRTNSSS